ncbi:MAG: mandelate racemase/muconate lactonizing enzyme family protein [Acetobacteraceae bacterium]
MGIPNGPAMRAAKGGLRIRPRLIEAFALSVSAPPALTPFGVHRGRQSVLVRATDEDGATGWGEAWCNFPSGIGATYRAGLVETVLAPLLDGVGLITPADAFALMTGRTRLLALQTGESGPLAQAIAGVDIALWDLAARRAGAPLWQLLGGALGQVPVYASGLTPAEARSHFPPLRDAGWQAVKVRTWGGDIVHADTLSRLRGVIGEEVALMADANQSWTVDQAASQFAALAGQNIGWIEEPIPANGSEADWKRLRKAATVPIAGGENLRAGEFDRALEQGFLDVVQPDMCKWGGFSGCLPLARRIIAAGRRYCPHYLGGGIGLVASAHLLSAAGGDGMLEFDQQENPLREHLFPLPPVLGGKIILGEGPGLGAAPDWNAVRTYRVR